VHIPTLQFLLKPYENLALGGVKPDHEIKPLIEQVLSEKDIEKEFALSLIEQNKP